MESNRVSKSASLSPGKTKSLAVSPCLRPLRRTAARPSGVLGPVLFCALRRLASIWFCVAIGGRVVDFGFWMLVRPRRLYRSLGVGWFCGVLRLEAGKCGVFNGGFSLGRA